MTSTTKTETVYRCFTMDFTAEVHYAVSANGRVFRRTRGRGWGGRYQNSAWCVTALGSIPADATETHSRCRLPRIEAL